MQGPRSSTLKVNETVITSRGADVRVNPLVAGLPRQTWKRLSAGPGAHGQRLYDWARVPIRIWWENGFGHWVLARRSITDPSEIAYYVCYGPVDTRLGDPSGRPGEHHGPQARRRRLRDGPQATLIHLADHVDPGRLPTLPKTPRATPSST